MPNFSFIVVSLCDKDFSGALKSALDASALVCIERRLNEAALKRIVTIHLVAAAAQRQALSSHWQLPSLTANAAGSLPTDWEALQKVERYLWDALEVRFCRHAPDVDHDGGSAYYNVHTKQVHLY